MTFADKLKYLRAIKGCTQREVSSFLSVSESCYSNYEQGIREPSIAVIKEICDFYNISADYLIGRSDEC